MIRKIYISIIGLIISTCAMGVPALRMWKTYIQKDGSSIRLCLVGDENMHYYMTSDSVTVVKDKFLGFCYAQLKGNDIISSGIIAHEKDTRTTKEKKAIIGEESLLKVREAKAKFHNRPKRLLPINKTPAYIGKKKAIVILACFKDKTFAEDSTTTVNFYKNVLNQPGFNQYGAPGSVHDYFCDMSRGRFDLDFDVVGPVQVSKSCTYYGGTSVYFGGTDHIGEFITEAITLADDKYDIDWSKYDWNSNGEVDQVFVLYAGYGQATGGDIGTIWPNKWTLDEALQNQDGNGGFTLKHTYINTYACGNELIGNSGYEKMGLGVFCHEFSHCLGLPDMYDTKYSSTPTMGDWDLLASGSYNGPGNGWCPAGWTSYERAFVGWLTPEELKPNTTIQNMKSLEEEDGKAYIIYNEANHNEYYLLENHKHLKWDAYTPETGLLFIHTDYDSTLFANNIVNTKGTFTKEEGYDGDFTNDHPRMAPISKLRSIANDTYYYTYPITTPRNIIDSLTDNSKPLASIYNPNIDGTHLMHKPIYNIKKDSDGNISFEFMLDNNNLTSISYTQKQIKGDFDIYDINGCFIGRAKDINNLHLKPGIYIKRGSQTEKIIIR